MKSGDVKKGVAPKTTKETLKAKKDRGILLRDSEEGIARIKRENKQAIEDFKKKHGKKTVEDLRDEGDWDPYGMASGGRTGYAAGKIVKGGKWFIKNLEQALKEVTEGTFKKELGPMEKEAFKWELKGLIGRIKMGDPLPDDMIQTIRKDPKFANITKTRSTDPDLYEFEDVILNYGKKGDVVDKQVEILEKFTPVGKGHATGGRVPLMYGGDPGFAFEYGGSWADWHDQHRNTMPIEQYIQTKLPKARLPFRDMQSGGLAYMLGEPTYMKYGIGGSVGHAPWHKPTGQQQQQQQLDTPAPQVGGVGGQPNPMKAPRGLPSLAPKTMDPQYMQQQAMQKMMMGQQQQRPRMEEGGMTPNIPQEFLEDFQRREYHEFLDKYRRWQEDYERRKDLAPTQEAAQGGRIGLGLGSMSRRAFMKMMAGVAALPFSVKAFQKLHQRLFLKSQKK